MTNNRLLAAEVGAKAGLLDVALRSISAQLELPVDTQSVELDVSWETSFERLPDSQVEYLYRIAVSDSLTGTFFVRADFALTYSLSEPSDFSEDHLVAFGEVSVVFSGFPYARELVQSLTTRASLPPLVLGTLRAPIDPPAERSRKSPRTRTGSTKRASPANAKKTPAPPRKTMKRKAPG